MVRKFIAALLLLVVTAWAEVLLAPMFTIRAGHSHPAHEQEQVAAEHHHGMPATHPCCPGLRKAALVPIIEFAATSQPCADGHRCCFRQGPQSAPAPVRTRTNDMQAVAATDTSAAQRIVVPECSISDDLVYALPPPTLQDMVFRI